MRYILLILLTVGIPVMAKPEIIAHRAASGYLPEHTLEALVLAYMQGADFIEQDLVVTKDDHLVVLHDIELGSTTDVAVRFPARARSDGKFYVVDFTLAEIKQLSKIERTGDNGKPVYPQRYQYQHGMQISTMDEQIELISELNRQLGQHVGWYPELKAPKWHLTQGKDIAQLFMRLLQKWQLNTPTSKLYVQCFDWDTTQRLRHELGLQTPLIQLIAENDWQESDNDYEWLKSAEGLAQIAKVADGIGPWIPQLQAANGEISEFLRLAQAQSLMIHPYTFRTDDVVLHASPEALLTWLFTKAKVDGVFTDQVPVVKTFLAEQSANLSSQSVTR